MNTSKSVVRLYDGSVSFMIDALKFTSPPLLSVASSSSYFDFARPARAKA